MVDLLTLAQAGPAAILLVGIVVIVRAFLTGAVVPRWVYLKAVADAEAAETEARENAKALASIAKTMANGKSQPGPPDRG